MSLKAFHVIFCMVSVLLNLTCVLWGVREYGQTHESGWLILSGFCAVATVLLVVYGVWFLRKNRHISYI